MHGSKVFVVFDESFDEKKHKKEVNIKWLMWQSEQICYLPKRKLEKKCKHSIDL